MLESYQLVMMLLLVELETGSMPSEVLYGTLRNISELLILRQTEHLLSMRV